MKKNKIFYLVGMVIFVFIFLMAFAGCENTTQSKTPAQNAVLDGSRYEGPIPDNPEYRMAMEFEAGQFLLLELDVDESEWNYQKGPYFVDGDILYFLAEYDWDEESQIWVANNPKRWGTGTIKDSGNTITYGITPMDIFKVNK
jgi:hypothetical protein